MDADVTVLFKQNLTSQLRKMMAAETSWNEITSLSAYVFQLSWLVLVWRRKLALLWQADLTFIHN